MGQRYGPGDAADDIFTSFLRANANYALHLEKDEAAYFSNLGNMVTASAKYNNTTLDGTPDGMTDWQFGAFELKEAAKIYCGGDISSCNDPGQDPQGRYIGIISSTFNKNKTIFDNTQDWIQQFAGPDGWVDRVEKYQKQFGNKQGTQGALDLLTELGNFRKNKDETLYNQAEVELNNEVAIMEKDIRLAASIGELDLSPGNPDLDYMPAPFSDEIVGNESKGIVGAVGPPTLTDPMFPGMEVPNPKWEEYYTEYAKHSELTNAVELYKIGNYSGAESAHNRYMSSIAERRVKEMQALKDLDDKRIADAKDALERRQAALTKYDEDFQTEVAVLKTYELKMGSKTGLEYDVEFKKSRKNVIEGTDFGKGAINLETLPSFKRLLARNLASWMDKYSEGSTKNEWLSDHNRMRKLYTKGGELKVSETALDILAVEAFFGPSNDVQISKMVEGGSKYGLLGDYGMDFPGHGTIGPSATEENAEEYMLQTYKLWNILNNIESDEDIQMPSVDNVVNPHDPHGYFQAAPAPTSIFTNPQVIGQPDTSAVQPDSALLQQGSADLDSALTKIVEDGLGEGIQEVLQQQVAQEIISAIPGDSTDAPINIPTSTPVPLDSALNVMNDADPALGGSTVMDAISNKESDVMRYALDKGLSEAQIAAAKPMIIKHLEENTDEFRPDMTWYNTFFDYLESADVYVDLADYLNAVTHKAGE